ncbi:hypothetical protein N431DRAFT_521925 [Stipitochalara longipes BDJ]|nr:hypothetical protein N431DRAFT_521925 [Stipitochalara longipes BDJ]
MLLHIPRALKSKLLVPLKHPKHPAAEVRKETRSIVRQCTNELEFLSLCVKKHKDSSKVKINLVSAGKQVNYGQLFICGLIVSDSTNLESHGACACSGSKEPCVIYGLGVVLTELAYWQSIDKIIDQLLDTGIEANGIAGHARELHREVAERFVAGCEKIRLFKSAEGAPSPRPAAAGSWRKYAAHIFGEERRSVGSDQALAISPAIHAFVQSLVL